MVTSEDIEEIFAKVTDRFEEPVPIGGRCESNYYYNVQDLSESDLDACAMYVANRIIDIFHPMHPELILKLSGGYSFFGERLSATISELLHEPRSIPIVHYDTVQAAVASGNEWKGKHAILVTDVITTARSSLEAHTRATLSGIHVQCWACLIDRTFGPGPVPVIASFTGEPVRLLTQLG